MKLMTLEVSKIAAPTKSGAGKSGEDRKAREARMKGYWQNPVNAQVYSVGKLLSVQVSGTTLAEMMVKGETLELESITALNGVSLPLQTGFKMSLKNVSHWGCPACKSAHGSGVYPSREVDATRLARSEFYYNPATKALFTISETCFGDYVKALGATSHIVEVPEPKKAAALKPTPAKA